MDKVSGRWELNWELEKETEGPSGTASISCLVMLIILLNVSRTAGQLNPLGRFVNILLLSYLLYEPFAI